MEHEGIGLLASFFVLICFLFDDEMKIRIFDAIGAFLFVIYGFLIGSLSNILMNSILLIIQAVKLYKLSNKR